MIFSPSDSNPIFPEKKNTYSSSLFTPLGSLLKGIYYLKHFFFCIDSSSLLIIRLVIDKIHNKLIAFKVMEAIKYHMPDLYLTLIESKIYL